MTFASPWMESLSPNISILEENGVPVEFRCPLPSTRSVRKESRRNVLEYSLREITVSFEYEFAVPDPREGIDEVLVQDLPDLEYGYLLLVARSTGLLKCQLNHEFISLWANNANNTQSNQGPYLVSLSTGPADEVDATSETCRKLVSKAGQLCVPIIGAMTAGYIGSEADSLAVQRYLYSHLQRELDSPDLKVHSISAVTFLGNGTDDLNTAGSEVDISNSKNEQQNTSKSKNTALASSLGVGFLIILFFVLMAIRYRRKRPQEAGGFPLVEEKQRLDLDSSRVVSGGSEDCTETDARCNSVAEETGRLTTTLPGTQADLDTPPLIPRFSDPSTTLGSKQLSTTSSAVTVPRTNIANVDCHNRSPLLLKLDDSIDGESEMLSVMSDVAVSGESRFATMSLDIGKHPVPVPENEEVRSEIDESLPPKPPVSSKPPVGPSSSKTIKVNRRKKKKKKQRLIRTNSRENVTGMETITEEKDAENEEKDSDCSEYSCYSTDEDDSQNGSRDPSPARSNPRSRDPSPSSLQSRGSCHGQDSSHQISRNSSSSLDDSSTQELLSNNTSSSFEHDLEIETITSPSSNDSNANKKPSSVPTWV